MTPGSPQKRSFPVAILCARAGSPKEAVCVLRLLPRLMFAPRDAARTSLLVSSIGLGGWSCNLAWVASDACYEVAAFLGKKKTARFKFTPPERQEGEPQTRFFGPGPTRALIHPPPICLWYPPEPPPDNIGSVMDKKRKITESNNEEPAQPEAAASNPMISPSVTFSNNTITMSPQMSNNQTSSSNDQAPIQGMGTPI